MILSKLKLILFALLLSLSGWAADKISFTMEAPQVVELGEQFRLAFSVNAKGTNLKLPDLGDFDVLMGPSTSQSTSFQIISTASVQVQGYGSLATAIYNLAATALPISEEIPVFPGIYYTFTPSGPLQVLTVRYNCFG